MNAAGFEGFARHVNPSLGRFLRVSGRDVRFVNAKGTSLVSSDGRVFDDWVAGFGSFNLGHNPEALVATVREHLSRNVPNLYIESLNPFAGELALRLVETLGAGFETCFFSNSGTEAVEAALKTAILATKRPCIAYAEQGYHGTTLGALGCMGPGVYREGLEAVLPRFRAVPFGDLAALETALSEGDVAGFLMEPIQMEAGVRIAEPDYLVAALEACRRAGTLFILDEVQTGMGRTGALFACQHAGAAPDILVAAKGLGGGLVPIGATLFRESLWEKAYGGIRRAEVLASTFGGNALSCRVALHALEILSEPAFLESVRATARSLFGRLESALAGSAAVARVSWLGLLGGIELRDPDHPWISWEALGLPELTGRPVAGPLVVERLFRRGIFAQVCAHDWSVVRVEPPLTVERETCARFVDAVAEAVRWLDSNGTAAEVVA